MQSWKKEPVYIPGACNLGKEETAKRYRFGYIGAALMIVTILIIEVFGTNRSQRWLLFFPAVYAMAGFVQAYFRFCFLYGFMGKFSIKGLREFGTSTNAKADRVQAMKLVVYSALSALAISTLYYFFPSGL